MSRAAQAPSKLPSKAKTLPLRRGYQPEHARAISSCPLFGSKHSSLPSMAEQRASRKTDRNRNGCRVALVDFRPRASSTAKRQRQAARVQLGPIVGDAHPHRHCTERGRALLLFTHTCTSTKSCACRRRCAACCASSCGRAPHCWATFATHLPFQAATKCGRRAHSGAVSQSEGDGARPPTT